MMWPLLVSPLTTIAATFAAIALALAASYLKGRQDGREAMLAQQLRASAQLVKRQDKVTERVRIEYRDRVRVVTKQGKEVVREVERLVPYGLCQLDGGFRLLHDAAAAGSLPEPAGGADGPPAPVEQAAAAEVVAGNYLACHLNAEQLMALQGWVRKQQKLNTGD